MANKPTYEELEQKVKAFERAESEHNQVEEKLWESEERHRLFVETMNEGMAIQRDQLLTYVNKAFCRMLGYSRDELIGKEIATLFDQENRKKLKNQMAKRREGVAEPYEITLTAKDGSQIYTIITPHSLYYEDNIFHGSSAIFTDITKHKQAEEALQKAYDELELRIMERTAELKKTHDELEQRVDERTRELKKANEKLEKANEETKTFAYIVSHDLKAPLLNIKGFSNELNRAINEINSAIKPAFPLLDEEKKQALTAAFNEDIPEALEFINSSVTNMDNLITSILKLSRLGHKELTLEKIDMPDLARQTLKNLAHQIEERQVKITIGSLPQIIADRISMEQILGNILTNALLYLDSNRPGEIAITGEGTPVETVFYVRDNGRGIKKEDMHKVFAPFRRAGIQDVPGEGMGLSYVQTLVQRHNGYIKCESKPGKGSTFVFTISNHLVQRSRS